mmetsp:Transcript_28137/g.70243  ORF Transcript_28137/g.70243 Transcript_28137/m.70243 type:complete len:260 (-) Transcript_28137:1022-1801(-)
MSRQGSRQREAAHSCSIRPWLLVSRTRHVAHHWRLCLLDGDETVLAGSLLRRLVQKLLSDLSECPELLEVDSRLPSLAEEPAAADDAAHQEVAPEGVVRPPAALMYPLLQTRTRSVSSIQKWVRHPDVQEDFIGDGVFAVEVDGDGEADEMDGNHDENEDAGDVLHNCGDVANPLERFIGTTQDIRYAAVNYHTPEDAAEVSEMVTLAAQRGAIGQHLIHLAALCVPLLYGIVPEGTGLVDDDCHVALGGLPQRSSQLL